MKIALAQIDTRVGDFDGNAARIVAATESAVRGGADLVVFPELVVTGYPPRDLLFDGDFVAAALATTERLAERLAGGPPVVLGTIARSERRPPRHAGLFNVAALLRGGRVEGTVAKRLLPVYDVFLEPRWFVPGPPSAPMEIDGVAVGLLVCEDLWSDGYDVDPGAELVARGAEVLVCISASPFRVGVWQQRFLLAGRHGVPLVFVNAVGANDELVFDGGSFVANAEGRVVATTARFEESVRIVDLESATPIVPEPASEADELLRGLTLGVRDFVRKNGLKRVVVGLSGGVDSALVACVAREAVGPDAVTAVAIPSRYTDPRSTEAARALADALGISFEVVELDPMHTASEHALGGLLGGTSGATAAENVQARLRAMVLMAIVNTRGGLLLNTSNKTELALGYGTLYGDMAGSLSVIGDVTKPQVYAALRAFDDGRGVVPRFILERQPSAELRPDQVDPFEYPRDAPIVEALVQGRPIPDEATDAEIARFRSMIRAAEHKRWQSGIVLKVSETTFGTGRLVPVTRV